jgi:hypothetical protein
VAQVSTARKLGKEPGAHELAAALAGAVVAAAVAGWLVPAVVDPVPAEADAVGDAAALGDACWVSVPTPDGVADVSDDPAAAGTATATRLVESRAANASLGRTTL